MGGEEDGVSFGICAFNFDEDVGAFKVAVAPEEAVPRPVTLEVVDEANV